MTNFSNIKFETKDVVKLVGFVAFMGSMWYDLRTEQIVAAEERKFLQYQVNQLQAVLTHRNEAVKP